MEPTKPEPKLPDMMLCKSGRMCGDHPSVTKTELNAKKDKDEVDRDKMSSSFVKISPSTSRTEKPFVSELRARTSEHAVRRRAQLDALPRADSGPMSANRVLIQAAMGSFRWPPYLVCVWVLVLLVSHVLHCLVGILERSLPTVRKFCIYFRTWTEESWRGAGRGAGGAGRGESEAGGRLWPVGLACVTALLYALYCALYALYAAALWAVEPLCADADDRQSALDVPKITNYIDEIHSNTSATFK